MRILVTGGAGFIGSCFIRLLAETHPQDSITNLDKLTYAGNLENLAALSPNRDSGARYEFVKGDIGDAALVNDLVARHDAVVNFAAESHVDRSILDSAECFETNVRGTLVLLEAARKARTQRFLHISTDEVYGDIPIGEFATESSPLRPSSPYAASKASAEMLVMAYEHTYGVPALITRASNNYGPFQFPEKFMPLMITNACEHRPLPVYGDGLQERDWIHVEDHCRALDLVLRNGRSGQVYNIGAGHPRANLDVLRTLLTLLDRPQSLIKYVTDRPGHDRRYALRSDKIAQELGWLPQHDFQEGLRSTVEWYKANTEWLSRVRGGEYREYYDRHYSRRDETWSGVASSKRPPVDPQS
jgi:dTDP-glucose 4,6-dehydratase